jgi:hypothetical protein
MSTLIQYEPFVDSTTKLFLTQTEKIYVDSGAACDFSRWLQFYAFDVVGEMTYSKRLGFLEENKDIDGIIGYTANVFNYAGPVQPLSHCVVKGVTTHSEPLTLKRSDKYLSSTAYYSKIHSTSSPLNMD